MTTVTGQVQVSEPGALLLPAVANLCPSSGTTAVAVGRARVADGVAARAADSWVQAAQDVMWQAVLPELGVAP
jgi:malate dehydrogenase (oxaloacetate-decarboxylating)